MSGKILAAFPQPKIGCLQIKPQRWMYGQRLDEETTNRRRRCPMTGPNGHAQKMVRPHLGHCLRASVTPVVASVLAGKSQRIGGSVGSAF